MAYVLKILILLNYVTVTALGAAEHKKGRSYCCCAAGKLSHGEVMGKKVRLG